MVRLETERMIIRDHQKTDLKAHHNLISNDEVMYYIQDIKTASIYESKDNLEFSISESIAENRVCHFFAMIDKVSNEHIGSIGFTILEKGDSGNAELGYFIHKEFWGKGFTTEACKAVITYGFETVGLRKFTTGCVYDNHHSEHIMKKLGMVKEAHKYNHISIDGIWRERVEYALFNEALLSKQEKQKLLIVSLAEDLQHTKYHFDGSTAAFVFGVNCEMDDIDITFPYDDELKIRTYFKEHQQSTTIEADDFKHFQFYLKGEKIHCLFYKGDVKEFSFEDDIKILHHVPVIYKSMSFYLRRSNNTTIKNAIRELMKE